MQEHARADNLFPYPLTHKFLESTTRAEQPFMRADTGQYMGDFTLRIQESLASPPALTI